MLERMYACECRNRQRLGQCQPVGELCLLIEVEHVLPCATVERRSAFVLFCFVWLATLGVPVVAPGTAAGPFPNVYRGAKGCG